MRRAIRDFIGLKKPATARAFDCALRLQADYLGAALYSPEWQFRFTRFTAQEAVAFIYWLRNRPGQRGTKASDNTVRQRIHLLRRLARHLVAIDMLAKNPWDAAFDAVPLRQRKQKRPTKLVPFDKVEAVLASPNPRTKQGIADRALLALLFGGGLRRSEVMNLNVDDVASTPSGVPFLQIRDAKAGIDQQQALPAWAWEAFSVLVSQRKSDGAFEGDALFPLYLQDGTARGRLSVETIYRRYRDYCQAVGIRGAAPHSARATAASYLLHLGFDERRVADFLRHKGTGMVQAYDKRAKGPETSVAPALVWAPG